MRRLALLLGTFIVVLGISEPANAFFHNGVTNPYYHAALDVLVVLLITAPLWTVYFWGDRGRLLMLGIVAIVQFPMGIVGLMPIVDPTVRMTLAAAALTLTTVALVAARRLGRAASVVPATSESH